jgi:hypothetical protein
MIALMWAAAWLPIGALLLAVGVLTRDRPVFLLLLWTAWGAVSGAAFAVALAFWERRDSFAALPLVRYTIWGAVGAMVLPIVAVLVDLAGAAPPWRWDYWWPALVILAFSALLGGSCAAATAALARRGGQS